MLAATSAAAESAAIARLRGLLAKACVDERPPERRELMAALHDQQFEFEILRPTRAATERLSALADLIKVLEQARLPDRDRRAILDELERLAMRIYKGERLFDRVLEGASNPAEKAGVLLNLLRCSPPLGALSREMLLAAQTLLATPEARTAMAQSATLRNRLIGLLPE